MHLQWCIDDNKVLLVKAQAHELIMSAMRAHPQAVQVQENACGALSLLAHNGHLHESTSFMCERAVVRDGVYDSCACICNGV
jgi:hypothetical protein